MVNHFSMEKVFSRGFKLCYYLLFCSMMCEGNGCDNPKRKITTPNRIVFLLSDLMVDADKEFSSFISNYKSKFGSNNGTEFVSITFPKSDMSTNAYSMIDRSKNFVNYVMSNIDSYGWSKTDPEYIIVGSGEGGVVAIDASRKLNKTINLKKVVAIGAPLNGYPFLANGLWAKSRGQLGNVYGSLMAGVNNYLLRAAGEQKYSCINFELTPDSDYLNPIHKYLSSFLKDDLPKVYIIAASSKDIFMKNSKDNTITGDNEYEGVAQLFNKHYDRIEDLFDEVAPAIRNEYSNKRYPDDKVLKPVNDFLTNTDSQGYYNFIHHLNGNKDHNGFFSVESQLAADVYNININRKVFIGINNIFNHGVRPETWDIIRFYDAQDYILNNSNILDFIFDDDSIEAEKQSVLDDNKGY